jgi:hypothetical protein
MKQSMDWIACDCEVCRSMCKTCPCWPTPEEARALIDAGYGKYLMYDWWVGGLYNDEWKDIGILCPAEVGHERSMSSGWIKSRCTFFSDARGCKLHELGLKPIEGRLALCEDRTPEHLHRDVAQSWNNAEAQALVAKWCKNMKEE